MTAFICLLSCTVPGAVDTHEWDKICLILTMYCMSGQEPSWGPDFGRVQLLWPGGSVHTQTLNLHMVLAESQQIFKTKNPLEVRLNNIFSKCLIYSSYLFKIQRCLLYIVLIICVFSWFTAFHPEERV